MFNVLIIDESKLIRWSLKEMLMQDDIQVTEAGSTDEAIACMKDCTYDLVFMDPGDDLEINNKLLEHMKKKQSMSKVILLSSSDQSVDAELFSPLRVVSVIEKPFNTQDVKKLAFEVLETIPAGTT